MSFRVRDHRQDSKEGEKDGGNQVDQDDEHSNNISLLAFRWGVFIFQQPVKTAHHLVHDSPEDGEELREKNEPLELIQASVEVRIDLQM